MPAPEECAPMPILNAASRKTLTSALLICLILASTQPPPAGAQGKMHTGIQPVDRFIAVIGLFVSIFDLGATLTPPSGDPLLPNDRPGLRMHDAKLALADDFNVGDKGKIEIRVDASFGPVSAERPGEIMVEFLEKGRVFDRAVARHEGPDPFHSYLFEAEVIGATPGYVDLQARVTVRGQRSDGWFSTKADTVTNTSFSADLNVAEPYEVTLTDPKPNPIRHGDVAEALLKIKVRTQASAQVRTDPGEDGQTSKTAVLEGAANAGAEYEEVLLTAKLGHSGGCSYAPQHPGFQPLGLKPIDLEAVVKLPRGLPDYHFVRRLDPVYVQELADQCPPQAAFDPATCRCTAPGNVPPPPPPLHQDSGLPSTDPGPNTSPGQVPRIKAPTFLPRGQAFLISGGPFDPRSDQNQVTLGSQRLRVVRASAAELEVYLPQDAATNSQQLRVRTPNGTSATVAATPIDLEVDCDQQLIGQDEQRRCTCTVRGTDTRLRIVIKNRSPEIVALPGNSRVTLVETAGGQHNQAIFTIEGRYAGRISLEPTITER